MMQLIDRLPAGLLGDANVREARLRWRCIEEGLEFGAAMFMTVDNLALRGSFSGKLRLCVEDGDQDTAYLKPFEECHGRFFLTTQYDRHQARACVYFLASSSGPMMVRQERSE